MARTKTNRKWNARGFSSPKPRLLPRERIISFFKHALENKKPRHLPPSQWASLSTLLSCHATTSNSVAVLFFRWKIWIDLSRIVPLLLLSYFNLHAPRHLFPPVASSLALSLSKACLFNVYDSRSPAARCSLGSFQCPFTLPDAAFTILLTSSPLPPAQDVIFIFWAPEILSCRG